MSYSLLWAVKCRLCAPTYIISRFYPRISQKQDTARQRRVSGCYGEGYVDFKLPPKEGGRRVKKVKNLAAQVDKESSYLCFPVTQFIIS